MKQETAKNKTEPSPVLPPSLYSLYLLMTSDNQRLFSKAFTFAWHQLNDRRKNPFLDIVIYYWIIESMRYKTGLSASELAMLMIIYDLTDCGRGIIHSQRVDNAILLPNLTKLGKDRYLYRLRCIHGLIERSTRDSSAPYLARSVSRHPVFIRMTPKGVNIVHTLEKDLHRLLMLSSYNNLTGANRKA
jgi:DNA-binding MarR family transcriptional regulator